MARELGLITAAEPSSHRRPPSSVLDELMTAQQMAVALQIRVSTIEDYARRGLLPSIKLGRHRRFVRSQVERAIVDLADPWQ